MTAQLVGTYVAGTSPIHRARAGLKLALLVVGVSALVAVRSPTVVTAGAILTLAAAAGARLRLRPLASQVRPALGFAAAAGVLNGWTAGPVTGVVVAGTLLVAVAAAAVVTLTTRTQDLIDALVTAVGPLRLVGVDPHRVALTLALAVRSVSVVAGLAHDVQEARLARGAGRSVRAFAVPLAIRTVRYADRLGEALAARGVDDD